MGASPTCLGMQLLEVTLQQALECLAVTSLVTSLLWDILYGIHNYGTDMLPYSNLLLS